MATVADDVEQVQDTGVSVASGAPAAPATVTKPAPKDDGPYSSVDPIGDLGDADLEEGDFGDGSSAIAKPAEPPAAKTAAPAKQPTATAAPTAVTKPAEQPEFDDAIIANAERYGFTKADAEAFGSRDALQRAMTAIDRREAAAVRARQAKEADPNGQQTQPAPAAVAKPAEAAPVAKPAESATTTAAKAAFEKFKVDLNPDEYEPKFVEFLNKLNDHYAGHFENVFKTNEALQQQLQKVTGQFQQRELVAFEQQMDSLFDNVPAPLKEVFGTGSIRSLVGSPQGKTRTELVSAMRTIELADAQAGRKPCDMEQLFQRALRMEHSDRLETIVRNDVADKVQQRRRQAISRPTSRETKAQTPEQKAAARANAFYKDKGFEVPERATDDDGEI